MTAHTPVLTRREAAGPNAGRLVAAGLWILQIAAAGMFLFAGGLKLAGDPAMVQMFGAIGVGQWFRYLTGTIEVVGGLAILIPSVASWAALALAITMAGAVITHLFIVGGNPAPAIVLLAVTATVAWARRRVW
jgi:uncharacterized membrane protein YphA (DoxX/SURF4 family)